jgi:SHS2 domain-containing protein
MQQQGWELFAHDADIGIRGCGHTVAQAFEQAALALTGVITGNPVRTTIGPFTVHCQAPDYCILLADWLNALIYEMAVRHMLFARFDIAISDHVLDASIWGEHIEVSRHQPSVEIKGATYTGISVERENELWVASCIVDV